MSETPQIGAASGSPSASGTWLGSQSVFDQQKKRKLGRAMMASLIWHGGLLALIIAVAGVHTYVESVKEPPPKLDLVYLKAPGPGGGGGGSPQPAPAKKLEIPKPKAAPPPVPVPPPPVPQPPPPPTLNAPVMTNFADALQAQGRSMISAAPVGGGGSGGGIGAGRGNGLGEGVGGGTGGGVYAPGNGVSWPTLVRKVDPQYTSEAMRAKIQGLASVDAVVLPNGSVGDVKIKKSLDRQYGLDQAALAAAKQWRFNPCKVEAENKPVPCNVEIELEFRLH